MYSLKKKRWSIIKAIFVFSEVFRTLYHIFSVSKCTNFIDSGHQCFSRIKYLKNYWGYYSKAKTEKCCGSNLCFCDTFRMYISCLAKYFLEVIAQKNSKMSIFEATTLSKHKVVWSIYVFRKILERWNLVQLHIFWKWVHTFHWKESPVGF